MSAPDRGVGSPQPEASQEEDALDAISLPRSAEARFRYLAAAAAAAAALLYLLIGLGVLSIGRSVKDGSTDLFGFGMVMTAAFVVVTLLLLRFRSRAVLALVAIVQVVVLVGYVALANVRDPQFEAWGLLVKACQLVVLLAVAYLLVAGRAASRGD